MDNKILDCLVIGGSAAGTAAAIYLARRGVKFKIITEVWGGEVATSGNIENWPGIKHTTGVKLAEDFREHLADYGALIEEEVRIKSLEKRGKVFVASGEYRGQPVKYWARTVILATGVHPRQLKVPGEKEYYQKGLSYCTVCDGPIFRGKVTATIGGGNSALESALMLSDIAKQEYVVNINPQFKGDKALIDKLKAKPNVKIIYNAQTTEILGNQLVSGLKYKDKNSGKVQKLENINGIFVHIGMVPNTDFLDNSLVEKNHYGEIEVDRLMHTKTTGLYAAGDATFLPHKQIVIAAGQGATAALEAVSYLNKLKQA